MRRIERLFVPLADPGDPSEDLGAAGYRGPDTDRSGKRRMITRTRFFSVHLSRSARSGPPPDPPPPPAPSSGLWWQLVAVAVLAR